MESLSEARLAIGTRERDYREGASTGGRRRTNATSQSLFPSLHQRLPWNSTRVISTGGFYSLAVCHMDLPPNTGALCQLNVGPPSATVCQHYAGTGRTPCDLHMEVKAKLNACHRLTTSPLSRQETKDRIIQVCTNRLHPSVTGHTLTIHVFSYHNTEYT